MIPKTIHYCWFGKNPIPAELQKYINSWKTVCPEYEIRKWDESNFDIHCHPFIEAAYADKNWAFVSDFARLKIIADNGGIYLDTDVELLKKPDVLLSHPAYFGIQQDGDLVNTGIGFGAEKGNPVLLKMLEEYDRHPYDKENKNSLACPYMNSNALRNYGWSEDKTKDSIWSCKEAIAYPAKYFDPISTGQSENLLCEDTFSIHHYAASWKPLKNRLKRKAVNIIGPEYAHKIKKLLKKS